MSSSSEANAITRRLFSIAAAAALLLALAGPAIADGGRTLKGESFLEGRNNEERTLQLEEMLVRVTDDTRIYNGDSQRISFEAIPDPRTGAIIVEFEGKLAGRDELIASQLVVKQQPR